MPDQVFTSGQILTASQMSSLQSNIGLTFIKAQSATSGTTMDITSAFSSSFDNYRVIISDLRSTGSAAGITMTLGTPSAVTSGYYWAATYLSGYSNGASVTAIGGSNAANFDLNMVCQGSTASYCAIEIASPNKATTTGITSFGVDARTSSGAPRQPSTGFHSGTNQFTSIQLTLGTVIANMDVVVYGYRKS
jgi:hypothetical protein